MIKKIICAFSFSIFILCFLQTTTHAITIKKLDLADSFHTEKTKNTFIPGEKIYVLYTINGLKETSSGTIWMDIDVSISDVTGNIIYKNVANQSIKDKRIIKNQIIDYLVFDIPVSIIDQTVFLNITFKDERSHERITKTLEVKILEQKLSIVNIHFTSDKSNLMERPAIYLLGE
ncbi:MAG: hypothetical protein HY934_08750, partial [Candidatus Firestonebacteria bacterium]|nr:hypothetical protein [Candidatus Firestonebacteria bacterium]